MLMGGRQYVPDARAGHCPLERNFGQSLAEDAGQCLECLALGTRGSLSGLVDRIQLSLQSLAYHIAIAEAHKVSQP